MDKIRHAYDTKVSVFNMPRERYVHLLFKQKIEVCKLSHLSQNTFYVTTSRWWIVSINISLVQNMFTRWWIFFIKRLSHIFIIRFNTNCVFVPFWKIAERNGNICSIVSIIYLLLSETFSQQLINGSYENDEWGSP